MLVLNLVCQLSKTKTNTQLMTVSTETVRMVKSRPRKNQSERWDLPCHIIVRFTIEISVWKSVIKIM